MKLNPEILAQRALESQEKRREFKENLSALKGEKYASACTSLAKITCAMRPFLRSPMAEAVCHSILLSVLDILALEDFNLSEITHDALSLSDIILSDLDSAIQEAQK